METDQYLGLFIAESQENLQKLNETLLKLETQPDNLDILNDIFRVAHTLKGMSKTMGFNNIGDLTHHMENLLDPLRNGTIKANDIILDTLFKCLDELGKLVQKVVDGSYKDNASDNHELIRKLQELLNTVQVEEGKSYNEITFSDYERTLIDSSREKGFIVKEITVFIDNDCVLPGARAFMTHKALEPLGEIIKTQPEVDALEAGDFKEFFKLFQLTQANNEEIIASIKTVSEIKDVLVNDYDFDKPIDQSSESKDRTEDNVRVVAKAIPQTIRVSADRMDKLMDLVGELIISKTRIVQISGELKENNLTNATETMSHITSDIQEIVMKLRMVTIEQVFNRFPRFVRDISKELGKEVNLKIIGKDTEMDRIVIDEIGDPLVHLIRNSLDHGLETPEERIQTGKTAKGTLELLAFNEGDNIIIRVSDDGRGIDPKKVKDIAVNKGVITPEEAKTMSDRDALELIFAPGFSTAKVATDISGRGVGMDVVKSKVAALGGNVSIVSEKNIGTTITIALPSSMAIVQALLIRVGSEIYAAPLNYISEVIDVPIDQIKRVQNREVIVLRGKTLPLIRLDKLLEIPNDRDEGKSLTVVILRNQDKYLGIIISELLTQQEIVIKPINKKLCADDLFSGATTLGDGHVALILNINTLLKTNSIGD
ncbi:MAG: hypothetical protein ACD_20C00002G0005 [uncultured bacterium]|nr:MAG: hypothetical protein ACD_20C00002G0005 [uncultured bacterium]HBH19101.1 chemotaxis protein CheA [Cyanobacteria bacterium UBA9579]